MNIKILGIIGVLFCMPVFAAEMDDDIVYEDIAEEAEVVDDAAIEEVPAPRAVVQRMSCDEINQRVSELREDVKSYPELAADLEYMLARQRTACAARANRRPVHNYENVNPVQYVEEMEIVEDISEAEQGGATDVEAQPVIVVEKTAEELEAEAKKIAENIAKGLCGDGTKPNRYGCCPGEKFKEVSQMKFACCPKDGDGECIEPRKK